MSEPTFEDRDFTSYRIFFIEGTVYLELVATQETPDEPELTCRYSQAPDGVWMSHDVANGDPPYPAFPEMAKVLDGVMTALTALNMEWLQS